MIDIAYCNNFMHLTDRPKVVAAGSSIVAAQCGYGHNCAIIYNVEEPQYDGSSNFQTADGTTVHSTDEWLIYLKKYCPQP